MHLHAHADPSIAADLAGLVHDITARHPTSSIVFNGDAFDLDRVDGEPGSGMGAQFAASRIARLFDTFSGLTTELRAHARAGGVLLFVAGNHDAEILLPAVQDVLAARLDSGSATPRVWSVDRLDLPQVCIEHGHQHDPDCAFFPDTRSAVHKQRLSALPLSSLMTRLFVSRSPGFDGSGDQHKTPWEVWVGVLKKHRFGAVLITARFPVVALRIAWQSVLARARCDVPAIAGSASMSSPWSVIRRLYFDRYLGACVAAALGIGIALGVLPVTAWWALGLACAFLLVPPERGKTFERRHVERSALEAASKVQRGARIVVFGHTHQPFVTRLGNAIYANHGAFCSATRPAAIGSSPADRGETKSLTAALQLARPYLSISIEPPKCVLLSLPSVRGRAPATSAHI
jgi:UDP-2,3-diacylglucosamine pyrophosphatase LpxH